MDEKEKCLSTRDWLIEKILGKKVLFHTREKGKFGRWLSMIWSIEEEDIKFESSYNAKLVSECLAKEYFGGKR